MFCVDGRIDHWRPFLYSSSTVTHKELTLNETHKLLVHADDDNDDEDDDDDVSQAVGHGQ
jgi:hypothetical protein